MPKSPEELEKMFSELEERTTKREKEFDQKLQMAERDTKQYKELAERNAEELRTFKQEAEKREKEQKESAEKSQEKEIHEFVEAQVKAGKIIPAIKEKMTKFMKSLTSESSIMEFTEKDGSKRSHTQVSLFKELILKMKPVMPLGTEFSVQDEHDSDIPGDEDQPDEKFVEVLDKGQRKKLPVEGADIAAKAFDYQDAMAKKNTPVNYEEALIAVSRKNSVAKA